MENKNIVRLHGEHINLCAVREDDEAIALYTKWMNDETFLHFVSHVDTVTMLSGEREWAKSRKDKLAFNIVEKNTDKLIGNCGIKEDNPHSGHYSLEICIGEECGRDKGYGTEVIGLLCQYCFETLRAHVIHLFANGDNAKAIRCYQKVGFKESGRIHEALFYEGKYHDTVLMEILRKDYYLE